MGEANACKKFSQTFSETSCPEIKEYLLDLSWLERKVENGRMCHYPNPHRCGVDSVIFGLAVYFAPVVLDDLRFPLLAR